MINYTISYNNPHRHFVDFEFTTKTNEAKTMQFQLSAWRPGRYELANFSQNIQKWAAFDENNNPLPFKKITKDLWEVDTTGTMEITVTYNFYANQLDAGACYLDEHQLYLNPVHCMFYIVDRMEEDYKIALDIPKNYKIASSMEQEENMLTVKGYDMLSESPIICSDTLQHGTYEVDGITFHLWFQGECKPDWGKLNKGFCSFYKKPDKTLWRISC